MPNTEFRYAALQTPPPGANSRRLMGVVMRYDVPGIGPGGRPEIFTPGAFGAISELDISLNYMHKRERMLARTGGGGLTLSDSGSMLSMTASLPQTREADDTLELVRTKNLRGLSVEFLAQQERMTNGTRIIAKAQLVGIGVVDTGAHDTTLEARRQENRARLGLRIRGLLPYGQPGDCSCQRGVCDKIVVNQGAYADALVRDRVILIHGDYAGGISSTKRGSLVLTDTEKGLVFESSVPDSQMGRDLIAQVEGIDVIARPIVDQDSSTFTEADGVATYRRMALRAIALTPTDAAEGWEPIDLIEPEEPRGLHTDLRKVLSWL